MKPGPIVRLYRAAKSLGNLLGSGHLDRFYYAGPGHYYSPIPDRRVIARDPHRRLDRADREIPGIDLRREAQLTLLDELASFYEEQPFSADASPGLRYRFRNGFFGPGDGLVLYGMLRKLRPARVIEVGSGWSSALMLDVNDRHFDGSIELTFVEPDPVRLRELLRPDETDDRLLVCPVQEVPLERFRALAARDILFIDSSHVSKFDSDVNYLLFEVLPALAPGVVIHVHDVFWPFEYPRDWLEEGRALNESYLVRAFLQYNSAFEILYFNSWMAENAREAVERRMPHCLEDPGSSFWIRRRG